MSDDSVNTGGAEQVYIDELKAELLDLQRDYAKADERIEELLEEDKLHCIVYDNATKKIEELKAELYECRNRRD